MYKFSYITYSIIFILLIGLIDATPHQLIPVGAIFTEDDTESKGKLICFCS